MGKAGAAARAAGHLGAALTTLLRDYIQAGVEEREESKTILGNRIRFRVVQNPVWNAKVIGFVFSADLSGGNCSDGNYPQAGVILDKSGNLYGTTAVGGTQCAASGGCGTAFELEK